MNHSEHEVPDLAHGRTMAGAPMPPGAPTPPRGRMPAGAPTPPRAPTPATERMPSLPFVWWAVGLALVAGFGLGAALFLAFAFRLPVGAWWVGAARAHGHIQIYGWGGMFALGVGLYFLPRLRGAPPPSPGQVRLAAHLMGAGLLLRALCQPFTMPPTSGFVAGAAVLGMPLSGVLELAGAGLAVRVLVRAARGGPPLRTRAGLLAVLPFALCFFGALLIGLALNLVALLVSIGAALSGAAQSPLVPALGAALDWSVVHLGLNGMLVAISAAISARTFPLYLRLRVPPARELSLVAIVFVVGFVLRTAAPFIDVLLPGMAPSLALDPGTSTASTPMRVLGAIGPLGALLEGASFVLLALVLDVPLRRTRRDLAGRDKARRPEDAPSDGLIVSAYWWLVIAGLLLVWEGLRPFGLLPSFWWLPAPPPDAERHALGTGLVTLLILGMAPRLVPGFVGRPLHSARLVWATLWLGNGAAVLRVVPLFLPSSPQTSGLLGLAGVLGLATVACLGWNLWRTTRST